MPKNLNLLMEKSQGLPLSEAQGMILEKGKRQNGLRIRPICIPPPTILILSLIIAVWSTPHPVANAQTRVGALTLNCGEDCLEPAVIDTLNGFAYFGRCTSPGIVVKVRLSDFTRIGAITLNPGEDIGWGAAVIDTVNRYAYIGTWTWPGIVVKIDLTTSSLRSAISSAYSSPNTLGFELTTNIYDNSGAGYMIAHRSGSKLVFTFNDAARVNAGSHELTFNDYGNAVLVGGRAANPTVGFYEYNGFAPLTAVVNQDGTLSILHQPDNTVVLNVAFSSVGDSNDYFIMERLNDAGHTVIILWGITQWGTLASGLYFDMQFSDLSPLIAGSYVIHWEDTNGNGMPDPGDTFTTVFSGT